MARRCYIGTSGWNYPGWQDSFYAGIPRKDWLGFCASRFNSLEVNATFYRQQRRAIFEHWAAQVPEGFRFAIKGNRYLTHNLKLNNPEGPLHRERERAMGLGDKLAVVLWQLPRNVHKNMARLEYFARALKNWNETRHAMEFRHPSWFDEEVAQCLQRHAIAVCQSDAADWPCWERVTTDLVYIRLHGHTRTYASPYSEQQLARWAQRVQQWLQEQRDVYIYFDNDAEAAAPYNALRLLELTQEYQV